MTINFSNILQIINNARNEGRSVLLEPEGIKVLESMGVKVPLYTYGKTLDQLDLKSFSGERVVVKVVSDQILHKSDVGGVKVVRNNIEDVSREISEMQNRLENFQGFLLTDFVPYENFIGRELLIGLRQTLDFGPILTFGAGGIYTEFLAKNFAEGKSVSIISKEIADKTLIDDSISTLPFIKLITEKFRGSEAAVKKEDISNLIFKFLKLSELIPDEILEIEVNPFAVTKKEGLIALDILIKLSNKNKLKKERAHRPLLKIKNLLEPSSAAIIGVSTKMNVGHIILNNFITNGFNKNSLYIIKPGTDEIEGCRCFASIKDLPEKVDIFVLCVPAAEIPEVISEAIKYEKAESLIVIPGGLEEKSGEESKAIAQKMYEQIDQSRNTKWKGPVINGGNCLGVISRPGKYDTMFIPEYKSVKKSKTAVDPLAFISQSGAFAISRLNKFASINPKYVITVGNQMDLTIGDYLTYLKDDPDIKIFAIYLEGFKYLDGAKFLRAAKEIIDSGKKIIFYTSGKTAEGAKAMASHTASIAGDYLITKQLCKGAGIIVAENFADFEDLVKICVALNSFPLKGKSIGIVSNAGCECVAASDNLGAFKLAEFSPQTSSTLKEIYQTSKIDKLVDIHNPIDLTPMANDEAYEKTARAILDDKNVNAAIISCVPLSPVINALPPSNNHKENLHSPTSITQRLINLHKTSTKPWIAVIDSGSLFDPMATLLENAGIPTFRTIDRGLKIFNFFLTYDN